MWMLHQNATNCYEGALVPTCHQWGPQSGFAQVEQKDQGKETSLQGTAREKMMSLSQSSYYCNLVMDSDRGWQKLNYVGSLTLDTHLQIEELYRAMLDWAVWRATIV